MDPTDLFTRATEGGDRRALARLLRIVEDRREGWRSVVESAWNAGAAGHLVGLTGAPGSGKSTLTNALVGAWRALDRRIGVVAVDPASPFSGGALLGDRIRMQEHIDDPEVFVRSMSTRGRLGGLADGTAALSTIMLAAGFDPVVVETVGVGQSEVDVIDHADSVVVVVTPGWGDSIQADKAGILEIADIFVINKADREGAVETRRTLRAMLEMTSPEGWVPPIVETVATDEAGIDELIDVVDRHRRHLAVTDEGHTRRRRRARAYVERAYVASIGERFESGEMDGLVERVTAGSLDPWSAAELIG